MTQGIAKGVPVGHTKGVAHNQGIWDFIYRSSLVRDARWNIGDRVTLPDGRAFRYAKSAGVLPSGQASEFSATGAIPYTLFSEAAAIGDKEVSFAASTHDAFAVDELRGGFFVSWPVADKDQFRGVIGNDVSAENAAIKIYLDGPLTIALTTAMYGEAYQNPYAAITETGNAALGKCGVPAVYVAATATYFWLQVAGPSWIAPQSSVIGNEGLGCFFRHDGSLQDAETALGATVPTNDTSQYAGYRMIGSYSGNGPLFFLNGLG